jgi:glucan phosphoethanolaminetransferase (alkaline phosphatase superfamily)
MEAVGPKAHSFGLNDKVKQLKTFRIYSLIIFLLLTIITIYLKDVKTSLFVFSLLFSVFMCIIHVIIHYELITSITKLKKNESRKSTKEKRFFY